jgi:hypothetical protein
MSDAIKLNTLVTLIATASITVTNHLGASVTLKIRDMTPTLGATDTGVPGAVNTQDCPLMAPRPLNFVSNVNPKLDTQGGDSAYKSIEYDLTYQFFFAPVGEGGFWTVNYGANANAVMAIMLYFMDNSNQFSNNGAEELLPNAIPALQSQTDAAGTVFHGAEISFKIRHFLED